MEQVLAGLAADREPPGAVDPRAQAALHALADRDVLVLDPLGHLHALEVGLATRCAEVVEEELEHDLGRPSSCTPGCTRGARRTAASSPGAATCAARPTSCQLRLQTVRRSSAAIRGSMYHPDGIVDASASGAVSSYRARTSSSGSCMTRRTRAHEAVQSRPPVGCATIAHVDDDSVSCAGGAGLFARCARLRGLDGDASS